MRKKKKNVTIGEEGCCRLQTLKKKNYVWMRFGFDPDLNPMLAQWKDVSP